MSEQITLRPEVAAFARVMEEQLRRHDGEKGRGYESLDMDDLAPAIVNYSDRLNDKAVYGQTPAPVVRAAADLANYAMFTALFAEREFRCPQLRPPLVPAPEFGVMHSNEPLAATGLVGGVCSQFANQPSLDAMPPIACMGCPLLPPMKPKKDEGK